MGRPRIEVGDYAVGAIIQAIENDPSRKALTDRKGLSATNMFKRLPSSFSLRRAMQNVELRDALALIYFELAKYVYPYERWYVIDATYLASRYYEKWGWVSIDGGPRIYKKMKSTKVFVVRGRDTGIVVAVIAADENVSDQTMFVPLFDMLIQRGAIVRGGGILADAGFNKKEHYELVKKAGGEAFLDFDRNACLSEGKSPHYDSQLMLYRGNLDAWHSYFDLRSLIEATNHAVKSIKRSLRAKTEIAREIEVLALIIGYNVYRLPELRLTRGIDLPFVDDVALRYIDEAIKKKRNQVVLGPVENEIEILCAERSISVPRVGWLRGAMLT